MFKTNDYWEEEFQNLKEEELNGIYFDNCTFISCDFSKAIISSCKFTECRFISCDLSLANLKQSTFNDVSFERSRLTGVSWSKCLEPFNVSFDSCNLSLNSFHLLDLRSLKFKACLIKDSGFEECNMEKTIFDDCDLELSTFVQNNLKKADFETSRNYLIDPKQNDIEKAIFRLPEALSFLSLLPIKLKG